MKHVNIIGAGFAGLTLAYKLSQRGCSVDLYERSSRVGGLLGTDSTPFGIAERAANAVMRNAAVDQFFKELELEPSLQLETSKKRFLFRGSPKQWPLTVFESLAFLSRIIPRALFFKSQMKPQPGETLEQWGLRNLGASPTRFILEPAMQGIYGNEISRLSASLILGPIFQREKKSRYKGLLTSDGGMQSIVDKLELKCRSLGVQIHLGSKISLSELEGPIVIATSAAAAAQLLESQQPELARLLHNIKMSSIMSVTLFFQQSPQHYHGFGCLIPRGLGLKSLGVLMNSFIFKGRSQTHSETWMLGGHTEKNLLQLSDTEIIELIKKERQTILQDSQAPLHYQINRWPEALPFYDLELEHCLTELQQRPDTAPLYLHGNYLAGIGLTKILERSESLAAKIATQHE